MTPAPTILPSSALSSDLYGVTVGDVTYSVGNLSAPAGKHLLLEMAPGEL